VFQSFVGAIQAQGGGGDGSEDVMGGLHAVFHNLSWRSQSNKVNISTKFNTLILSWQDPLNIELPMAQSCPNNSYERHSTYENVDHLY